MTLKKDHIGKVITWKTNTKLLTRKIKCEKKVMKNELYFAEINAEIVVAEPGVLGKQILR